MYTLYYSPGACSMAVHVVLNELNVEFSLENLSGGKNRSPEFLKINSLGQVPTLSNNGQIIREGAAILVHLLENNENNLLPKKGKERDAAFEALMFCNATLHPAYGRAFFIMKAVEDQKTKDMVLEPIFENINKLWEEVESRLSKTKYLAGDSVTVADILLSVIANWMNSNDKIKIGARAKKLIKEIASRPAFKKALESEQIEYKAAA